ncbi:MAG TPA: class I SAM-dependent methyltransferase, partial [Candidatus Polarisedimenticolia bacterium]|nr:class I SAM-dependent methyltransferase [Candidatus Polarisedimenticolia bacterium]
MKETSLQHLVCPRREGTRRCGGTLDLARNGLALRRAEDMADEVLEGLVRCGVCGAEYPVISGVLVLVNQVERYLARFWRAVLSSAALHGTVSEDLARWLEKHHPDAPGLPSADQRLDVNLPGSMDRLADLVGGDARYGTFAKFLREWQGRSPYDRLAAFAQGLGVSGGLAIDSGCGAGAMALRLAPLTGCVLGVDHTFGAVLLARRLLLHQPRPMNHYELRRSAEVFELRSAAPAMAACTAAWGVRPMPLSNADFLVGDSLNLPVATGAADLVAGANIIDVTSLRAALRESARVLKPGGLVLLTDPFKVSPATFSVEAADPVSSLKEFLSSMGLTVLLEEDFVPWVWYL